VRALAEGRQGLELEALDSESPNLLELLHPPDSIEHLPAADLTLEANGLDSFASWSAAHLALATGLVRETGLLSGARFGRVALEAYQLAPVLRVLAKPRPSLLVADDVGLGKTIEAGLILLELMARGRAKRVLIVAPPGLLDQWHDELQERFGLEFVLLDNAAGVARAQTDLPAGVNPWDALPLVLTSVEFLKRETIRRRALRKRWDLVIVDEAHALAESGTPTSPYRTQRHRLGLDLRESSRGLVLLTATPHNGYRHSFRSLLELVDPTLATFEGDPAEVARRVDRARIRRMKRQLTRSGPGGQPVPVFPLRRVEGIPVTETSKGERELLTLVASYCAGTARAARGTEDEDLVSFAMQIVRKRSLSSRRALEVTVARRLEALQKEAAREAPPEKSELRDLQAGLPLSDAAAERVAERVLRSAIPKEEKRRKSEVAALKSLRKQLQSLPARDPKLDAAVAEILRVLASDPEERLIVFTEYLDTLGALAERFEATPELAGRYVVLRGGLSRKQRRARQERFESGATRVLLATDAASEGLNLQRHCRRVLHVELPWNPNRLEQRNGRVDRYGQSRNPEIRYLFYPESPEEEVLSHLVGKIESMQGDRISTPDILGVWMGGGELERELTELGADGPDLAERMARLVRTFEDRTAEFVREVQPLVAAGSGDGEEMRRILDQLGSAEPLPAGGEALERALRAALGDSAFSASAIPGCLRIQVPIALRGTRVPPVYSAATFDRNVAVRFRPEDVEYLTPAHPLAEAVRFDARRRFLQVYSDVRGLAPRRLAARRVPAGEPESVLFTFLARLAGGGELVEEHLLALRVGAGGELLGESVANLRWLDAESPGEVPAAEVVARCAPLFDSATSRAREAAFAWTRERALALAGQRREQAALLRRELELDLSDRLREIDAEESRARAVADAEGQQLLFEKGDVRTSFDARRKAAEAQAAARRAELADYERIDEPGAPALLGALFLVPDDGPEARW
jgi:superfamily II DNA or RNA helicase